MSLDSPEGEYQMDNEARLSERRLAWPNCYNVRDLGGLPAAGGRVTRWQAVVRTDYCRRLTAVGWQALVDYGVRIIIDLRSSSELDSEPYEVPPDAAAAGVVRLSLPLVPPDPELDRLLADPANHRREYAIIAERCAANIAAILRGILNAAPGGVAIHCQAGKDRTGTIVGMLLDLAGVPREIIMADYIESEERLMPVWDGMVAEAMAAGVEPDERMKPLAWPEVFANMLDHFRESYGGTDGYLAHIGLSPEERQGLTERLLG